MNDPLDMLIRLLHEEQADTEALSHMVIKNSEAVKQIIDGLTSTVETYRYNCNRVIVKVAEKAPMSLYPYWNDLAALLASSNTYHRCSAINVLPHLIPADEGVKFKEIFDRYFSLLDDESVIPPCYIARNCGIIASHLPELAQNIVSRLLAIDDTHHKPERRDLIKADIIQAFDQLYDRAKDRAEILSFAEGQLDCSSVKTRKAAKAFMQKHGAR